MTTQAQALQMLRDFLNTPDDAALRRKAIRFLAHQALRELRKQKKVLDDGFGDRLLCPRCWGTTYDEIGEESPCRRCLVGGRPHGTIPKP